MAILSRHKRGSFPSHFLQRLIKKARSGHFQDTLIAHALTAAVAVRAGVKMIAATHAVATIRIALSQTEMPRMRSHEPRKYRKTTLSPIIEALINGRQRVGEAFKSRSEEHTS